MPSVAVIIAARMKSTRFPNKPLVYLGDKPMIRRTFDNAEKAGYDTFVLSDSQEVLNEIPADNRIMTSTECRDGTHRCMTVIGSKINYDIYVYVRGDFPDIDVESITNTVNHMSETDSIMSHAYTNWIDEEEKHLPGRISMIHANGIMRWTTRAILPYGDKVVGLYGYRNEAAKFYEKTKLYNAYLSEKIDVLVWLENGYYPTVYKVPFNSIDINFPEDVNEWNRLHGVHL